MASIQAFIRFDPERAAEQAAFVRARASVLREAGGQMWVRIDSAQVATLVDQGLQVSLLPEADVLQVGPVAWQPGIEEPQPPASLRAALPQGDATAFWWLRCVAPADKDWLVQLAQQGAEPLHTLDPATGVWRMTAAAAQAVAALPFVVALGLFHPAFVPGLDLCGLDAPLAAAQLPQLALQLPPDDPAGNVDVRAFDGIDEATLQAALEAAGAVVVEGAPHGFTLRLTAANAAAVLSVPGLLAASTATQVQPCTFNAGVIVGANQVRNRGVIDFTVNLDGTGEVVGVVDSGCDAGTLAALPVDLAANVRVLRNHANPANPARDIFFFPGPPPTPGFHGTHVVGTVCADGTGFPGPPPIVGIASNAAAVVQGPLPNDFRVPFDFAVTQGVGLITNSYGHIPVGPMRNRYIANRAEAVDRWCWQHPEVLVLFAAGNEETDANNDGVLDRVGMRQQAVAKNALTVGASENLRNDGGAANDYVSSFNGNFNTVPGGVGAPGAFTVSDNAAQVVLFSGRGAVLTATGAATGRIKPDLLAPGTNLLSLRSSLVPPVPGTASANTPPGVPNARYAVLSGSSMATPVVAGSSALVRQFLRTRYGQQRRPLLLEGVPMAAAPPQPVFASRPAIATHADGLVMAWVTPELPANAKRIVALRVGRHQAPVDAAPVVLQADVGDHAALQLATIGETTFMLHRHRDGKMRLSAYTRALAPLAGFGTAGVVTLTPDARPDDAVPPTLLAVGDQLACVWPVSVGNGAMFQRFKADTGAAVDVAAISLLFQDGTGPQRPLAFTGSRYTVCGVVHGATFQLQLRQIDSAGQIQGAAPTVVLNQANELRDPCLLWDASIARHLLIWCDARSVPGGELWMQFLDASAVPLAVPKLVLTVPAANRMRRPLLLRHPDAGYLLAWEDDTQNAHFDLYCMALDANAQPDGRVPVDPLGARAAMRLSDSPADTSGFAVAGDADGFVAVYQDADEVNADRIGVQTLNITKGFGFEAQQDPATPLQKSGRYVVATLLDHTSTALSPLSAAWSGASWDLLRLAPGGGINNSQQWLRLTADGLPDSSHGVAGVRELPFGGNVFGLELLWSGNDRRIAAINDAVAGISVHLADAAGTPVATFGTAGAAALLDSVPLHDRTTPQLGFFSVPAFTVVVAYGSPQGGTLHLRMQRLNDHGVRVGSVADLATCDGVAAHQWFQFVNGEATSIAIYHRTSGTDVQVLCRRFNVAGVALAAEQRLSAAAGEARNGVTARRPTAINSINREYAAAWQYRPNAATPWSIRFSRLDRQGRPLANPPVAGVVQNTSDVVVIDAATAGWSATRDAVEPQLAGTFTHEGWSVPPPAGVAAPEWSPCLGLAWIGVEPDGTRRLYFTVLDENGRQLLVPQPPPYPKPALPAAGLAAPLPAPIVQLGTAGARVQDFRLAWNGRVFLLTWTEEQAGRLRHCVTLVNRHASQLVHELPTAALLRAVLVNGATNLTPGPLPDITAGYGWGLLNLRQALVPALPATLQVRDDCAIGPGRSVRYHCTLPPGTALLRVTLNWTDEPGPRLVRQLQLTLRTPGAAATYRGNLWDTAAGRTHLSRPIASPPVAADAHENVQTFKQIVLANPAPGDYEVEVTAAFAADSFDQQNLQPFALVLAGSGPEVAFNLPLAAVAGAAVY